MGSVVKNSVKKLKSAITGFIENNSKIIDNPVFDEILAESERLSLTSDSQTDEISECLKKFRKFVTKKAEKSIESALKKQKMSDMIRYITVAIRVDLANIKLVEKLTSKYKEYHLYNELSELYKMIFIYTSDTKYLEKMGDIDCIKKDYESAINNYLGYAETSDPTPRIYKKLAKVFGNLGDEESKEACLAQVKLLESGDE